MKLQKQCANKELSEKLWELGVRVDSLFYWTERYDFHAEKYQYMVVFSPVLGSKARSTSETFSALTSSELGEIIFKAIDGKTIIGGVRRFEILKRKMFSLVDEANNRAKLVIYLIEQGLVKVEDIIN